MTSSPRAFRVEDTRNNDFFPRLLGTEGAAASENHLATHAAADILKAGGNAVDAMVAGVLVEGLVDPHMHTIGGECPIIIAMHDAPRPVVINGNTVAPRRATIEEMRRRGYEDMPAVGVLAAGVPATLSALLLALQKYGTMSFGEVAHATLKLAQNGFAVHRGIVRQHKFGLNAIREYALANWPGTAELYFPHGKPLVEGEIFINKAFASVMEQLVHAERGASSRAAGIMAVHDAFYSGFVAEEIARFVADRDGLLAADDMSNYRAKIEAPVSVTIGSTTLYKCGYWNQGPALLQALSILIERNVGSMRHNSAEYVHAVIEALKLSFADREQYFGDPAFAHADLQNLLLDPEYIAIRAALIDDAKASQEFHPGDPALLKPVLDRDKRVPWGGWGSGTVHVDTVDKFGNMVSATPSGAWVKDSEVIPSLGFPLGNRLMTFYFEPAFHPNLLSPGRMPRTTISPSLAYRDDKPWFAFGSMGGDQQDQWQLQLFLNCALFGMTPQQGVEAPKFSTDHCPGFFAPHSCTQAHLRIEAAFGTETIERLRALGHNVEVGPDWTEGFMLAVMKDGKTGVVEAACDPRCVKSEIFSPAAMAW